MEGRPMAAHKFKTGQHVTIAPNRYGSVRRETFVVVRVLPEEHGVYQYRIKSSADGHERVVLEYELATAPRASTSLTTATYADPRRDGG